MSLLQKRKFSETHHMPNPANSTTSSEGLIYCLSMMSVVNMTFGNPLYDNYFEGVKTVIGPKKTQAVFNELKNRDQKSKQNGSSQSKSSDSEEYNRSILEQMNRIIGDKINQEIGKRVKQFQMCIDSCMKLAAIPQAATVLINILKGKEEIEKSDSQTSSIESIQQAKELIQSIRDFLGEDQVIQLIHHSLRKLNIARDFISTRSIAVKAKGGETSDDIATSSTLSDEESMLRSQQLAESSSQSENISKLHTVFKETILVRIIPTLSSFQESVCHIKNFESIVA